MSPAGDHPGGDSHHYEQIVILVPHKERATPATMRGMNVGAITAGEKRVIAHPRTGPPIWLPLAVLVGLSVIVRLDELDLKLQRFFWSPTTGWFWEKEPAVQFLYQYGNWPALIFGGAAAAVWIISCCKTRWQPVRPLSLFLVLALVVGPGIMVNAVFKDHFGRSRPRQTHEFGGDQTFQPLGEPGFKGGGKSFPSGHASTGFYWLALFVFFWDRQRNWAWVFGVLGMCHGLIMGLGRMAQGGHWASDVLWAGGLVYLTAWLLHYFLLRTPGQPPAQGQLTPASATWLPN